MLKTTQQVKSCSTEGERAPTTTTKAAAKRKSKKKKLRAPESTDEKLPRTGGKNAGRQYTAEELNYALSKTQLARMLERDPILSFLRPKPISELTGPIQEPDWESIADVRTTVHALFMIPREAGFVMGPFEMEKVFDWVLASWKDSIRASSVGSDSSIESLKRMPMSGRLPRIRLLTAEPERAETPSPEESAIPKVLEDANIRLMQSTSMRTTNVSARPGPTPTVRTTPPARTLREPAYVAMESVSSQSTPRSERQTRYQDEDPEDLFDLETWTPGTAAAVSTATVGTGLTRVCLSVFSDLKEFHGREASEEKARAWFSRVKSASRRDGMTGEEVCALFGDVKAGPARHSYPRMSGNRGPMSQISSGSSTVARANGCMRSSSSTPSVPRSKSGPPDSQLWKSQMRPPWKRSCAFDNEDSSTRTRHSSHRTSSGRRHQRRRHRSRGRTMRSTPRQTVTTPDGRVATAKTGYRSLGPKPVRIEPSVSVYAFVIKKSRVVVSGSSAAPNDNTSESKLVRTAPVTAPQVAALRFADEYAREPLLDSIDLQPRERRGYWKHSAPLKWYKQANIHGKLDNRRGVLLLDTGAEESILDTTFAREIGCLIDTNVTQNCVGIRDETYYTVGRTRVKITLAGNLVYFMELWVADLVGQHATLGVNFMIPAGVRINTADGTACLPGEVRIQVIGRRPLYGAKMHPISVALPLRIGPGRTRDIPLRPNRAAPLLWVTRGKPWVTTLVNEGIGRKSYLRVTNIGECRVTLDAHTPVGWWAPTDAIPRAFGVVQLGSRRYQEWQNLVYGATGDADDVWVAEESGAPMVARLTYQTPRKVLSRDENRRGRPEMSQRDSTPVVATIATAQNAGTKDQFQVRESAVNSSNTHDPEPETGTRDEEAVGAVLVREGSDLYAEELEAEMAILPDLSLTAELRIEDIKVGQPTGFDLEVAAREGERLRQIIWVICDIDVGDAKLVAQRVRKIPRQFKEKVVHRIKGLLSAGLIQPSASRWASPIVVIVKKNGVDIRHCIDYRLVNGLTRLTVYPMPLVNDLLEDLDKYLWYCSLDMARGFWVVPRMDRTRLISAFITPLGLFEWLRMSFGLCNAPQIYQRLIANALYGFLRLSPESAARDGFEAGETERPGTHSSLGRRSYIDDILIGTSAMLHDTGRTNGAGPDSPYDVGLAVPIQGTTRPTVAAGCSTVTMETGDLQVRERRGGNTRDVGCEHNPNGIPFSAVVWKLPGWEVARPASGYAMDLTVNEAEYRGLLLGCSLPQELEVSRLVVCGDSNLVIRQMREEMDCKSPGLKLLRQLVKNALQTWPRRELFHVRRDWNASADMLAGQALQHQDGLDITGPDEIQSLRTLNRLGEIIRPRTDRSETSGPERTTAPMLPVTTRVASAHAAAPQTRTPEVLQELGVQCLRLDRVRTAQDEELWIANLKRYLRGELEVCPKGKRKTAARSRLNMRRARAGRSTIVPGATRLPKIVTRSSSWYPKRSKMTSSTVTMRVWKEATKASDERSSASGDTSTDRASSRRSTLRRGVHRL
ncbi:unnamed protein product [Phytophthora fragariaefolia]|uniref:Unnamed protein product n=1 Tax=Phytophthora fragariaefolia TaxID=1490495 RepID=A0A9W6TZ26_9STRA|nr:unnamed protein product [Phytophthora fragariaefolia]